MSEGGVWIVHETGLVDTPLVLVMVKPIEYVPRTVVRYLDGEQVERAQHGPAFSTSKSEALDWYAQHKLEELQAMEDQAEEKRRIRAYSIRLREEAEREEAEAGRDNDAEGSQCGSEDRG